jgi:hypothetical protein
MTDQAAAFTIDPALLEAIRRPPVLPIEEAEKCFANAARLYRDSNKSSTPTKAALIELGLEETAKAGMLFFRGRIARRLTSEGRLSIGHGSTLPAEDELDALLLENLPLFTADALDEAFRNHKIKLRFFEFSLDFLRVSVPLFLSKEYRKRSTAPFGIRVITTIFSFGPANERLRGQIEKLVTELKRRGIRDLDELAKQAGLYVDLAADGSQCRLPAVDPELLKSVSQGAAAAQIWTLGLMYGARRQEQAFSSWSMRRYARWIIKSHSRSQ